MDRSRAAGVTVPQRAAGMIVPQIVIEDYDSKRIDPVVDKIEKNVRNLAIHETGIKKTLLKPGLARSFKKKTIDSNQQANILRFLLVDGLIKVDENHQVVPGAVNEHCQHLFDGIQNPREVIRSRWRDAYWARGAVINRRVDQKSEKMDLDQH